MNGTYSRKQSADIVNSLKPQKRATESIGLQSLDAQLRGDPADCRIL